jgi:hypothetical protein
LPLVGHQFRVETAIEDGTAGSEPNAPPLCAPLGCEPAELSLCVMVFIVSIFGVA